LKAGDSVENKLVVDQNQKGQKDRPTRNRYIHLLILDFSVSNECFTSKKTTRIKRQQYSMVAITGMIMINDIFTFFMSSN
jgi:hypothetical protein